jgi:hypothetical protein
MNERTRSAHRRPVIHLDELGRIKSIDVDAGSSEASLKTDVCDFKIKNGYVAGWLIAKPLENKLRAFCDMNGLELKLWKSGLMFKDVTFIIKGSGTQEYANQVNSKVSRMLEQFC